MYITGANPRTYNGLFVVSTGSTALTPTRFRICMNADPGTYLTGGTAVSGSEISALSWSASLASATLSSSLASPSVLSRRIYGTTPASYSTSAPLARADSTHFTYSLIPASSPGPFTAETPPGMMVVQASSLPPKSYLNHSLLPLAADVHVRVDVTRSYDSASHRALLNIRTYVGDTFGELPDTCSASDFTDLTEDLSALCPNRIVTIEQDSVPIADLATITGATWSANQVTITTASNHGIAEGAQITVSGITPAVFNGVYTAHIVNGTTLTYALPLAADPGGGSGGAIQPLTTVYFGFTTARGSSNESENQSITILGLQLHSQ